MTAKSSVFHMAASSVPAPVAIDAEAVPVAHPFAFELGGGGAGRPRPTAAERELERAQPSEVCTSERAAVRGRRGSHGAHAGERREDRVVHELVPQRLVITDREESQEHDQVIREVARVLEACCTEPLAQLEDERTALVVLVEEVVADVRVARGLGPEHRVEVERSGVRLLQRAQLRCLGQGGERPQQGRSLRASLARELGASPRVRNRREVWVREHVGEGVRERLPSRALREEDAQKRRSPGLRKPNPASCLCRCGSSVASIWSSRASGGRTKRSLKVGIDVSRKIASASSAHVLPAWSAASTSSCVTSPTVFDRMSTRTAKSLRYTLATISSFPAEKRLARYRSGARDWSTFDTDGIA